MQDFIELNHSPLVRDDLSFFCSSQSLKYRLKKFQALGATFILLNVFEDRGG